MHEFRRPSPGSRHPVWVRSAHWLGAISFGAVTLLVTRYLSAPLRPLDVKSAFRTVKQKWKTLFGLVSLTAVLSFFGFVFCVVPGLYLAARFSFLTQTIVMENLRGRAALKRSNELFKRSPWKITILTAANFVLPAVVSLSIMLFISAIIGNIPSDNQFLRGMGSRKTNTTIIKEYEEKKAQLPDEKLDPEENYELNFGSKNQPNVTYGTTEDGKDSSKKPEKEELSETDRYARGAGESLRDLLFQFLWFPIAILITSFTQVLMALMYVKTRQAGGEPMRDLLKQFEDDDKPQTRWQERIQKRLIQSGRITGKN